MEPKRRRDDAAMNDKESYFAIGTWPFYRRAALVPLCLCLVAAVHLYRVVAYDQTQWKGGGFGMFSTVDSRSARYVRLYLLTGGQEIPVVTPTGLSKRVTELRAIPTRDRVEQLADELAGLRWRAADRRWNLVARRIDQRPADRPLTRQDLHPRPEFRPTAVGAEPGQLWPVEAVSRRGAAPSRAESIPVEAVRVELWRYDYDGATKQLRSRRQFTVTRRVEADS